MSEFDVPSQSSAFSSLDLSSSGKILDDRGRMLLKGAVSMVLLALSGAAFAQDSGCGTTTQGCTITANDPPPDQPPQPPDPPSGGGTSPPDPTLATIKVSAYALKCQIKAKGNFSNTEYAAFIYMDSSGALQIGPLTLGNQSSATVVYPSGVPYNRIVGYVHSHDPALCTSQRQTVTSPVCVNNEYAPSGPASSPNGIGDWGAYNQAPFTQTWGFQNGIGLFMVDPDGAMRYFPPSNQTLTAPGQVVTGTGC